MKQPSLREPGWMICVIRTVLFRLRYLFEFGVVRGEGEWINEKVCECSVSMSIEYELTCRYSSII